MQLRRYNEVLARDQETTARLAVAGERIRLARELHDVLAHTVMVMVWQAEEAEELLDDPDRGRSRESLRNVLVGRDSLVRFALRNDRSRQHRYPRELAAYRLARLRSQREVDAFLRSVAARPRV